MLRSSACHKAVHEMQTAVQPGEQFILDLVVDRERDLGAVRPDFGEIDDAHEVNVSTHGLERIWFGDSPSTDNKTVRASKPSGPRKLKSTVLDDVTVAFVTITNCRR